jgi:hypothetical protein
MGWFARTVTLRLRPPVDTQAAADALPATAPSPATPSGPATPRHVRSLTLREATAQGDDLRAAAQSLLKVLWRRQPIGGLGLVLSNLQATGPQMPLFPLARPEGTSATADTLRARSGLRVLVDQRWHGGGWRRGHGPARERRTG